MIKSDHSLKKRDRVSEGKMYDKDGSKYASETDKRKVGDCDTLFILYNKIENDNSSGKDYE